MPKHCLGNLPNQVALVLYVFTAIHPSDNGQLLWCVVNISVSAEPIQDDESVDQQSNRIRWVGNFGACHADSLTFNILMANHHHNNPMLANCPAVIHNNVHKLWHVVITLSHNHNVTLPAQESN